MIQPWHRRMALTIASQLPDDVEDATIILELTRELLGAFISEPEVKSPVVVPIGGNP
jgi:hypothetical protein